MDIKNNFSFSVILLIILVFISAIAVVYVRHSNRLLFIGIDGLAKKQDELYYQRSQLILENETLSSLSRIDTIAKKKLDMDIPKKINILS
tara:strand:+ start:9337 stop:9606 length:270 start_codon:yes stop_codon:yes gene_type:complete